MAFLERCTGDSIQQARHIGSHSCAQDRACGVGQELTRSTKFLLAILLIAAAGEFVLRGPVRFFAQSPDWNDFILMYIPARAWLQGANPYSPKVYADISSRTFGYAWSAEALRSHPAYPLNTFVLVSPLAPFSWPTAQKIELALALALIGAMIFALTRAAKLDSKAACLFAAATLGLAPIHSGLATGNVSIPAIALACIAVWAVDAQREVLAGILLAVVLSLKPQIGILFLGYYVLRRRWTTCRLGAAGTSLIALIGAARMYSLGPRWVSDFMRNARIWLGSNSSDNFASHNPMRYTLIDLQVPFYDLTGSRTSAVVLALALAVVIGLGWLFSSLRTRKPDDLLDLSLLATLSLLPVYHRLYDASLLVLPIAWALSGRTDAYSRSKKLCWPLFALFLIPGSSIVERVVSEGWVARRVLDSWWWVHLVLPHEGWGLMLLAMTLLWAVVQRRRASESP